MNSTQKHSTEPPYPNRQYREAIKYNPKERNQSICSKSKWNI